MGRQLQPILQNPMQPLLKRHLLNANQVPQRHHRTNLHRRRMDKHLPPIFNRVSNKPIRQPKILLSILLVVIVQVNIQVLKILATLGVLLGGHVEDMGNAQLEKVFGLEARDEVTVEELWEGLDRLEGLKQAVTKAPAEGWVGKPVAVQLLLVLEVLFGGEMSGLLVWKFVMKELPWSLFFEFYFLRLDGSMSLKFATY